MKHTIYCLMVSSFMVLSGCSMLRIPDIGLSSGDITSQASESLTQTINGTKVTRTKSFVEDKIVHTNQLSGYQLGSVDVYMITPSGNTPEVIWFKNISAIKQLTDIIIASSCKMIDEGDFMISVPDKGYQNQIDTVTNKLSKSGQDSLTPEENSIYSMIQYPCPYSGGGFKILGAGLAWYRNPKNGGGVSSYITDIQTQ